MTPHSTYHHASPLPAIVWCCTPMGGPIPAPRFGEGRVFKLDMGEEYAPRKESKAGRADRESRSTVSRENIVSAMSKTRWMTASEIAMGAGIYPEMVRKAMQRNYMAPLIYSEQRLIDGRLKYVWRLK